MLRKRKMAWWRRKDSGQSLYLIAAGMVFLLGVTGVAIDLTSLYLARSEAQRAADAAALAGAATFVTSGYTSGLTDWATVQTLAKNQAATTGNQNKVGGQSPAIDTANDVSFNNSVPTNPRITVTVQMTKARGDAMPTFFMKVFGVTTADIRATATAEAYAPSGGTGPAVGTSCVKPWVMPNVDPNHWGTATAPANACPPLPGTPAAMTTLNWCAPCPAFSGDQCPATTNTFHATFVDPTNNVITNRGENTGLNAGGAIGEPMVLKPGQPSNAPAPSQFYPIQIPPGDVPAQCPSCAPNGQNGGASLYEANISCCNTDMLTCNQNVNINTKTGNMQGPTEHGVECLINETNVPAQTGQDTLCSTSVLGDVVPPCGPPFTMYGGPSNPNPALRGQPITSSPSVITVPLYSGQQLNSGGGSVTIIGFLQVFINQVDGPGGNQGNVHATVLNISACGSSGGSGSGGGGSGSGTVTGGGGQLIPIRLVQPG